jgi:Outer membrane protein and related peptidoglycan-associated (lipo)proteins
MTRKLTVLLISTLFLAACVSPDDPNQRAKRGAAIGAAAGAVAGAIIGNQSGDNRTGAVVGAAVGAGVGAAVGHRMDSQQKELQQIEGVAVTRPAEDELNVELKNDVLFDVDSSALRGDSQSMLKELASVFARYPDQTIAVEGHADSTGSEEHNQVLSERRAASVSDYLADSGVNASRIDSRGYGETRPKASNDTPEGRQLNRRVEIHVKAMPQS